MGIDPDAAQDRAKKFGANDCAGGADFPHGWRMSCWRMRTGNVWALGVAIRSNEVS